MVLRPISFSITATTKLKLKFSDNLSESLSAANFNISSLGGNVDDLEILNIEIESNQVLIETRPQVPNNFYLLQLLDTEEVLFLSDRGSPLINDDVSRTLFFVGIDRPNYIRDRLFKNVPSIFGLDNTKLNKILSAQSDEMLKAAHSVVEMLGDNYISVDIIDERYVRGRGAYDRFANGSVYKINRVSKTTTGLLPVEDSIEFLSDNEVERNRTVPRHPVALQQVVIEEETISQSSSNNSFSGFLINFENENVIKLLSLTLVASGEEYGCDGNVGEKYNVEQYRYSIADNTYDSEYAFSRYDLESNQVLLSEMSGFSRPEVGDTIIASYIYKDKSRFILEDSTSVYRIESVTNEATPTHMTSFFLGNAPIVTSSNEVSEKGGATFKLSENDEESSGAFQSELKFNYSRLPSRVGEYSIDYSTGEVFVVGEYEVGDGTGGVNYYVDYLYRNEFINDLDYIIEENDFVANSSRNLPGEECFIDIKYDHMFSEGIDYRSSSHIEVLNEPVENRLTSSFSLRPENTPVTGVNRIVNQTTGEIYNHLYSTEDEIFFSGTNSPRIETKERENAYFARVMNEDLEAVGEFVCPAFKVRVSSRNSSNSIFFSPPIPAELINFNSKDYWAREVSSNSNESIDEDLQIRFFGNPDGNNLIHSIGIKGGIALPSVGTYLYIGVRGFVINLANFGILNKSLDAIGSFINSSFQFEDLLVFENEKYYEPLSVSAQFSENTEGGLALAISPSNDDTIFDNLSKLRKVGDYSVDYRNGVIYLAASAEQEYEVGYVNYFYAETNTVGGNIFSVINVSRRASPSDDITEALMVYENISNDLNSIAALDIENTLHHFESEKYALDSDNNFQETLTVLGDYTVVTDFNIIKLDGIWEKMYIYGSGLNENSEDLRIEDLAYSKIIEPIDSGGKNLYVPSSVTYEENIIDLKRYVKRRPYSNGEFFEINIIDKNVGIFRVARATKTGEDVFDDDLNVLKAKEVQIFEIIDQDDDSATLSVYSQDERMSFVDSDGDLLLDKDGNRYEIISVEDSKEILTVALPAQNNSDSGPPSIDFGGESSVIVKATVTITEDGMYITIPEDSIIEEGEVLEIEYLPSWIPDIGTELSVDYRYGNLYFDYMYIYDDLYISYEYGDNSIDWSISDSMKEGEGYFVSYQFGASRNALRNNFGTLTNIPFFSRFPLNVDRELYRGALSGVLQAFPKGPVIPAFEDLISSFTGITPNIEEMALNKWILGRDYLSPDKVLYDGVLKYSSGRFEDGLYIEDGLVVDMPALSNLRLEEGTFSCWIRPDWGGISNDADLTFYFDNLGSKSYMYSPGANILDFDNGFKTVSFADTVGGTDLTGETISMHNYRMVMADHEESMEVGVFAINKGEGGFGPLANNEFSISSSVSQIKILGGIPDDGFNNKIVASPLLLSCYDDNKVLAASFDLKALSVGDDIVYLGVFPEDLTYEELPPYDDGLHITRSFNKPLDYTIDSMLSFRTSGLDIVIALSDGLSLGDIYENDIIISEDIGNLLYILDSRGALFRVNGLIDEDGNEIGEDLDEDSIIHGISLNRIPENRPELVGSGADSINSYLPTGIVSVVYPTINILAEKFDASSRAFGFEKKSLIVDWLDGNARVSASRDIKENIVDFNIADENSHKEISFKMFYSDLPSKDYIINLYDHTDISELFNENNFLSIACVDSLTASDVDISKIYYNIDYRFNVNDIYIGKFAYNPKTNPFTINKDDYPESSIGIPGKIYEKEGIFIWFDELCESPLEEGTGQWIFRSRISKVVSVPESVSFVGDTYETILVKKSFGEQISGTIITSGEFSSVTRSARDEDDSGCCTGLVCRASYRYCGGGMLDDIGWVKLEDSESDLINVVFDGRETAHSTWLKSAEFDTSYSDGIYRMGESTNESNYVYTPNPCYGGSEEFIVSARVVQVDSGVLDMANPSFSGAISGSFTGITVLHTNNGSVNIKIALAVGMRDENLVLIIDAESNSIEDIILFNWDDGLYHEYKFVKVAGSDAIEIYIDNSLYSKILDEDLSSVDFDDCAVFNEPHLAIHLLDGDLINPQVFYDKYSPSIIDVDFISYNGVYIINNITLEDEDTFISTDSKIVFDFNVPIVELDVDGYDAYSFGHDFYSTDFYDGYFEEPDYFDVDEICMTSDRLRYIIDSGVSESKGRFSVFKDGKGFINFRIFDDYKKNRTEVGFYNLATNIKYFKAGELHHVAASWRLNSLEEKDEMHLFIDGLESPNIYKFGGSVPVRVNDKFSDVSKEMFQNFIVDDIEYSQIFEDGTVLANESILVSEDAGFTSDMVGLSIIIEDSDFAGSLAGGQYIIGSVSGNEVEIVDGVTFSPVTFTVSYNKVPFKFAPMAGVKSPTLSDLRNEKISIFRTDCDFETEEIGGIFYEVVDGEILIVAGENVIEPKFRANVDTRIIEFVGRNSECNNDQTVFYTDLDVHIETSGLISRRVNSIIELSASSYNFQTRPDTNETFFQGVTRRSGAAESYIMTTGPQPLSIDDVKIKRIVFERTAVDIAIDESIEDDTISVFDFDFEGDDTAIRNVITERVNLTKTNMGRYLSVSFDSDNVRYCDTFDRVVEVTPCPDGYADGYGDGYDFYADGYADAYCEETETVSFVPRNIIIVYGETTDGDNQETFVIDRNGSFDGEKLFLTVDRIEGEFRIYDPDYFELGVVSLTEKDEITIQNNSGSYAEINDFFNGVFVLTEAGSNGGFPFELPPGRYSIDYPAYLKVFLPSIGERLYIGCDINGENQLGGVMDEFRIISEMSSDTRPVENETTGTRSITRDYNRSIPMCLDDQTLSLIHFNNPIEFQARRLRTMEYLNEDENYKYSLTFEQREDLIKYINDQEVFTEKMVQLGFSDDEALRTYYEAHKAESGPIKNYGIYLDEYNSIPLSSTSVNDSFGKSGVFTHGNALLYENDRGIFRADEGTIEFWISPLLDVKNDNRDRYYLDIYSIERKRVLATSPSRIDLSSPASSVVSIRLLRNTREFSGLFSQDEIDNILFDDLSVSEITGRLSGGTGTDKDFSPGSSVSPDGKTIYLADPLPGFNIDVVVTYIPLSSDGDRISIFKDEDNNIVFRIFANGEESLVKKKVSWRRNDWHRVSCYYKANSGYDTMGIIIDNDEGGQIGFGDSSAVYGGGMSYGQVADRAGSAKKKEYTLSISDSFRLVSVGANVFGAESGNCRMDNLRFSRGIRKTYRNKSNLPIDPNYSENLNTALMVAEDDMTTLLINFDEITDISDRFAGIIDPKNGIFDFSIEVVDDFGKVVGVNDGEIEDLIVELVNRLKPAHCNALVKFSNKHC